jgi:hypothetical protein
MYILTHGSIDLHIIRHNSCLFELKIEMSGMLTAMMLINTQNVFRVTVSAGENNKIVAATTVIVMDNTNVHWEHRERKPHPTVS